MEAWCKKKFRPYNMVKTGLRGDGGGNLFLFGPILRVQFLSDIEPGLRAADASAGRQLASALIRDGSPSSKYARLKGNPYSFPSVAKGSPFVVVLKWGLWIRVGY